MSQPRIRKEERRTSICSPPSPSPGSLPCPGTWPWPLASSPSPGRHLLSSPGLLKGFLPKAKIRKQRSADNLWNSSLWHCPSATECTFSSCSQAFRVCQFDTWLIPEDSQFCCLLWWLGCDGCIPTSIECSVHNCTALSKEAAGYLWALCCCPTLVQDWSRLTCNSDIHSKKKNNYTAEKNMHRFRVHFLLIFVMSNFSDRSIGWNSRTQDIYHIQQFSSNFKGWCQGWVISENVFVRDKLFQCIRFLSHPVAFNCTKPVQSGCSHISMLYPVLLGLPNHYKVLHQVLAVFCINRSHIHLAALWGSLLCDIYCTQQPQSACARFSCSRRAKHLIFQDRDITSGSRRTWAQITGRWGNLLRKIWCVPALYSRSSLDICSWLRL